MEYCKTVDSEIIDKNENININEPNKASDEELIKTVENLQKLEEMKEKKKEIEIFR